MNTNSADHGTAEFRRKHPTAQIDTLDVAGSKTAVALEECFLDSLYRNGKLRARGEPQPPRDEEARRRLQAGLWLRSLYHKAGMQKRVTMAYSVFGQGGQGEHPEGCRCKECDSLNWHWRLWCETMRDLGQWAIVCRDVCCFDRFPPHGFWDLKSGLNRLADLRGL